MTELEKILITRDGMTLADAQELIQETREALLEAIENGDDPEEVLADYLGLEPDYLFDLI